MKLECPVCSNLYDSTEKFFESKRLKSVLDKKSNLCICILCLAKRKNAPGDVINQAQLLKGLIKRELKLVEDDKSKAKTLEEDKIKYDIRFLPVTTSKYADIKKINIKVGNIELNIPELSFISTSLCVASPGVIYVVGPKNGPYKIGYTTLTIHDAVSRVNARMQTLQIGCWEELKIHHISRTLKDVRLMESMIHSVFQKNRLIGEWFSYDINDIINIVDNLCDIHESLN
jgi:hypothetical protein